MLIRTLPSVLIRKSPRFKISTLRLIHTNLQQLLVDVGLHLLFVRVPPGTSAVCAATYVKFGHVDFQTESGDTLKILSDAGDQVSVGDVHVKLYSDSVYRNSALFHRTDEVVYFLRFLLTKTGGGGDVVVVVEELGAWVCGTCGGESKVDVIGYGRIPDVVFETRTGVRYGFVDNVPSNRSGIFFHHGFDVIFQNSTLLISSKTSVL